MAADRIEGKSQSDNAGLVETAEIIEVINLCPSFPPTIWLIFVLIASWVKNAENVCFLVCATKLFLTAILVVHPFKNDFVVYKKLFQGV